MRQNINVNPSVKLFESFADFSGGMNTETSNERLRENEMLMLNNVDLSGRGSLKRRTGRVSVIDGAQIGSGVAQGLFFYYRKTGPDLIAAVGGRLYLKPNGESTVTEIPIDGLPDGFQATLPIEAVQYKDLLFIATGTKLVEYDGTTAKVVEPYRPSAMEAIYIGTNGLADDPDSYIQDGTAGTLTVSGIKPNKRSGVVNVEMTMTAFISKPESITAVEYKWEYQKADATTWTTAKDFNEANKSWTWKPETTGSFNIKVTARNKNNTSVTADYTISNYPVKDVPDKADDTLPVNAIQTCRKIVLHWDRILMTLDSQNPSQVYISDLNNPRYFPVTNTINFDANKQEPVTAMVRYKDMLVIFTRTTIQTLIGKAPADYRRALIHNSIGCIADRTAKVIGNHIAFLSNEGVQFLAPSQLTLDTLNVRRVDLAIKSLIEPDPKACALVYDDQYWLCLPSKSMIYRFGYESGIWVRDVSSRLNIIDFEEYDGEVYELTANGNLYKQDKTVYADDGEVYRMTAESKYHDLSAAFNQKRLKRIYLMAKAYSVDVNLFVKVYADSAIVLNPEFGHAEVTPDGWTIWTNTISPNFVVKAGSILGETWVLGETPLGEVLLAVQRASVLGKCRRVKVIIEHEQDSPCEIFAYGLEFKAKRP